MVNNTIYMIRVSLVFKRTEQNGKQRRIEKRRIGKKQIEHTKKLKEEKKPYPD